MYLPQLTSGRAHPFVAGPTDGSHPGRHDDFLLTRLLTSLKTPWPTSLSTVPSASDLRRRDSLQNQNITIGVVVGIFLTLFLVALFYFLHRYSASIRLRKKKRSRRRGSRAGSGSSKGSTSSTSTQGSAPPDPAAA